jgi:hypothetical protein
MKAEGGSAKGISIDFDTHGKKSSSVTVTGVAEELLRDPGRIRKLMDLLDLPKGTNARLRGVGAEVIVR